MLLHKHKKPVPKKRGKKHQLKPIDKLMYVVSFVYPATAMPQLYKVYHTHNVESLSLTSWSLYVLFGFIFVLYAISQRLRPLVIEGTLWLVIYILGLTAILLYS